MGFKKGGGGGLYSAGLITGLKQHFKTNSSADQNTSCIHSRFYASKRCKKSIQYKLEGGLCSAGLITRCTFSLQVDRGLISGAGGGGVGGEAYKRKFTVLSHCPMRTRCLNP